MLLKAAQDFGDQIDLADSWMVGDMATDIGAGKAAGVQTVLTMRWPISPRRWTIS